MLKEKAKWSSDLEERKAAIKKLSTHGEDTISVLQEIMNITAYEDIRNACAEAIKSIQATSSSSIAKGNNSMIGSSNSSSSSGIGGISQRSNTGLNTLFDSAREYYVKGDYKKADIFFERVLEIEPNHIEALNDRGTLLLYRLADYDKARNCFEKVLQMDSKNIVALNSLDILNHKKGGTSQQKEEKPAPSVETSKKEEKPAPSVETSKKEEKPAPPPPPSVDTTTTKQKEQKPAAAAPSVDTGTTSGGTDPRNPYNDPTLPYYKPDLGKGTDTIQSIQEPSQSSSKEALTWNEKGMSLYNSDKYEEAIKSYDKAIELDPKLAMAWHNKGNVLYTLERPEEAIKSYDKAIELDPKLASALFVRASIKAKKDETENALSDLKKAIEIDKEYIESAKQANDFEIIRDDKRFKDLIQQKERPAASSGDSSSGTTSGGDPRNPYNDPTLPYYKPDLDKKNNK
jgi:tetratricopeptide (TPR) repeat protein